MLNIGDRAYADLNLKSVETVNGTLDSQLLANVITTPRVYAHRPIKRKKERKKENEKTKIDR